MPPLQPNANLNASAGPNAFVIPNVRVTIEPHTTMKRMLWNLVLQRGNINRKQRALSILGVFEFTMIFTISCHTIDVYLFKSSF